MFSPASTDKSAVYKMAASPISLPPSSPYSPGIFKRILQFSELSFLDHAT
jgi:hypothetical protein